MPTSPRIISLFAQNNCKTPIRGKEIPPPLTRHLPLGKGGKTILRLCLRMTNPLLFLFSCRGGSRASRLFCKNCVLFPYNLYCHPERSERVSVVAQISEQLVSCPYTRKLYPACRGRCPHRPANSKNQFYKIEIFVKHLLINAKTFIFIIANFAVGLFTMQFYRKT